MVPAHPRRPARTGEVALSRRVAAYAHRGWHIGALAGRENTFAAFEKAVAEGYRHLETDVHLTADGRLVAFHDPRLDRVTDARGAIADLPWSVVGAARVAGLDPIPLFEDLVTAFPDVRWNVDAKTGTAVRPLVEVLRRTGSSSRVCTGSFSTLRTWRLRILRARAGARRSPSATTPLGVAALCLPVALPRALFACASAAQVPVDHRLPGGRVLRIVDRAFVDRAHRAGLRVDVWTVDDADEMRTLIDRGVDGIMTDRPDVLREVLIARGLWEGR